MARAPARRAPPPEGAVPAALPDALAPELATPVERPPPGDWLYEIKFDGCRMLARVGGARDVRLVTGDGDDWTARLPVLHRDVVARRLPPGWYDGEIVLPDRRGLPDAGALRQALEGGATDGIVLYLFDAPFMDGRDLRRVPLELRRERLQSVLRESELVRFSHEIAAGVGDILSSACKLGLAGVVGKRRGSSYVSRRSDDWVALKCTGREAAHGAERLMDPSTGLTKADLMRYYEEVAPWILPHLKLRPAYVKRAPEGLHHAIFFQQHPENTGLRGTDPRWWPGHEPAFLFDTAADLAAAAHVGMIEIHTWNSTAAAIALPDRMVFDLDPGRGVSWRGLHEAALLVRAMLQELGLASWPKTTGGKGLHVIVPLRPEEDYPATNRFSRAVVEHMARTLPDRFVAKSGSANRVGRIFIDFLRNGQSQSTCEAFSARARPGLGVAMPVGWDELGQVEGGAHWTIANAIAHLRRRRADPWAAYWDQPQRLGPAMDRFGIRR